MKKVLSVLIAVLVASVSVSSVAAVKPVPTKKIAKKHKKAEGATKVADTKPEAPAKKKK